MWAYMYSIQSLRVTYMQVPSTKAARPRKLSTKREIHLHPVIIFLALPVELGRRIWGGNLSFLFAVGNITAAAQRNAGCDRDPGGAWHSDSATSIWHTRLRKDVISEAAEKRLLVQRFFVPGNRQQIPVLAFVHTLRTQRESQIRG